MDIAGTTPKKKVLSNENQSRRNFVHFKKILKFPETTSPRTLLNIVGDSIEGKVFLKEAINELIEEYENMKTNHCYFYTLATYYVRLNDYKMAL